MVPWSPQMVGSIGTRVLASALTREQVNTSYTFTPREGMGKKLKEQVRNSKNCNAPTLQSSYAQSFYITKFPPTLFLRYKVPTLRSSSVTKFQRFKVPTQNIRYKAPNKKVTT